MSRRTLRRWRTDLASVGHRRIHSSFSIAYRSVALVGLLTGALAARALQSECVVEVPVNVVLPTNRVVSGIRQEGFSARSDNHPLVIKSVSNDTQPRRVLLVVETGRQLPREARKVEVTVLTSLITDVRPQDSFGLLTAVGPRREIRFGTERKVVEAAIQELEVAPAKSDGAGALDVLNESLKWFEPPQPGDSVVLMAMGIEGNSRTRYSRVAAELAVRHVRLFSVLLGPLIAGYYYVAPGIGPRAAPQAGIDPNGENLSSLSWDSGGYMALENTLGDPWKSYKLTDARLQQLQYTGAAMYEAIIGYYRMELLVKSSKKIPLKIDVDEHIRRKIPQAFVTHPAEITGCSP